MATRQEVYAALDSERDYQQKLIDAAPPGDPDCDPRHGKQLAAYVLYMESYVTQAREQLSRVWGPESAEATLHTVRKIAALGVAAMEEHGAPKRVA